MPLSLIVAMTRSGVIGRAGGLPWRLSSDLKRFKSLTMGHHLLMGRKTYESLGRPLPGRTSVVITSQPSYQSADGVLASSSLDDALQMAKADNETFVIGGGQIFELALPLADRMYVTWVEGEIPGDTFFPAVNLAGWQLVHSEPVPADAKNEYDTTYCIYERKEASAPAHRLSASAPEKAIAPADSFHSPCKHSKFSMPADPIQEILDLNQKLLNYIVAGDWRAYDALCEPSITCFEPEARGQLVVGMGFHKYYFDLPAVPQKPAKVVTMSRPHVRLMGDEAAVVSYVRLTQSQDAAGQPQTSRVEETRVWQKIDGEWKHVHFHRSGNG